MRTARVVHIDESELFHHYAEFPDLERMEPKQDDPWAIFIGVCLCIVATGFLAELVRAAVHFSRWAWMVR